MLKLLIALAILLSIANTCSCAFADSGASINASDCINRGERQAGNGNWQEAASEFALAVAAEPNNLTAVYDLGVAYVHTGQLEKAAKAEQEAVTLNPQYVPAYVELSCILTLMGDLAGAEEAVNKALQLDPTNRKARGNLEVVLKKKESLLTSNKILKADDKFASGKQEELAAIDELLTRQDYQSAANACRIFIEKAPGIADGYIMLGFALSKLEQLSMAKEQELKALEIDPNNSLAHGNLGVIIGKQGDIDGEICEEQTAVKLDDKNAYAYANLGWALARKDRWNEAFAAYKRAADLNRDLVSAMVGCAIAQAQLGEVEVAIKELKSAVNKHPESLLLHLGLGCLLIEGQQFVEAKQEFNQALQIQPDNREAQKYVAALARPQLAQSLLKNAKNDLVPEEGISAK